MSKTKLVFTVIFHELNQEIVEGSFVVDVADHSSEVVVRHDHVFGVAVNVNHLKRNFESLIIF